MNPIARKLFPREADLYDAGVCPFCELTPTVFRDEESEREFRISGLCQDCQDKTFGV